MAKILINEHHSSYWFERLSSISYYSESDFEKRLIDHASSLFSKYYVIPFKKTISILNDPQGTTTPDLAFIKKDYSSWILVEVELKGHTFEHVEKQVKVMLRPVFNKTEIIKYMIEKQDHVLDPPSFHFDKPKLTNLITNHSPEVMVIVDQTHLDWEKKLNKIKVLLCVVQMYKNGTGEEIMRTKGQFPKVYTGSVHCRIFKGIANSIEVINHHELLDKLNTNDTIEIYLNGALTRWIAMRTRGKKLFLKCMGTRFPITPKKDLTLQFDENNGTYLFENN